MTIDEAIKRADMVWEHSQVGDDKALRALAAEVRRLQKLQADGDTCGRQCEGTAYRIEARTQKRRADELEKEVKRLQHVGAYCPKCHVLSSSSGKQLEPHVQD